MNLLEGVRNGKKIKIFFPNGKDFIETDSENLDFYLSQGYKKEEEKTRPKTKKNIEQDKEEE